MGPSLSPSKCFLSGASRWLVATATAVTAATPAAAHGFGQRYDLPLPLSLYLAAAGVVVALSFVVFALFMRAPPTVGGASNRRVVAIDGPWARAAILALKLVTLALFILIIAAGIWGDQNPFRNIAPTLVWVVWWVGYAYVSALFGNLWALSNPWRTLFDAFAWACRTLGVELSTRWRYPRALGVWPACVLLLAFSWIELVYPNPAAPGGIACLIIAYSMLTWFGMFMFGRDTWLGHGEVFSVVFDLFARLAPVEFRERELQLRSPGAGLVEAPAATPSMIALVLLLLATVLYDGFLTSPQWSELEDALAWRLPWLGTDGPMVVRTAALIAFWLIFLAIYGTVCRLMSLATGGRCSSAELAASFALTLIPIALGYHVAHYLTFLLLQGQYIVPLISDPFGFGWSLLGTASYRVGIGLVDARFSWYTAVAAIVLGHVAAVYLAHVRALRLIGERAAALRSQVPLTVLMVIYTCTGLSIIADPIVERRTPATPAAVIADAVAIPPDALVFEPDARVQPAGPGRLAAQKLTYRVLGSAFHDGARTGVADLIYAYAFAHRWGVRRNGDARYDPFVDNATVALRSTLGAVKVTGADATSRTFRIGDVAFVRELFTVEIYTKAAIEDVDRRAAIAAPWSTLPWHVVVLMEEAVGRDLAAFSQAEARRRGVPWLDLVRSAELSRKLLALVEKFQRDGHRPDALRTVVSADDARRRWAALAAFYNSHGHFLVTNGPYRLKRWSPDAVTVEAFRDLSYPLGVGSYDAYAVPRRAFVTKVAQSNGRLTLSSDVEVVEKFQRSHRLVRTPLSSIGADLRKRLAPECRYTVVDDAGRVVVAGAVQLGDGPDFQIALDSRLSAGRYTVFALIALAGNVMNAEIRRIPLVVDAMR
jgi:hypothetical protein